MAEELAMEDVIQTFVYSVIEEKVNLKVSRIGNPTIFIKHIEGDCLSALQVAKFWLRVFTHQNNYPMPKYCYKPLRRNKKVFLKVDEAVTLTIFLKTGMMLMQGKSLQQWFCRTFRSVMRTYIEVEYRTDKQSEEEFETLFEAIEQEMTFDTSLFDEDDLSTELACLQLSTLRPEATYIYPLWKSLLYSWFTDPNCEVYIAVPFLDVPRLVDICQIVLKATVENLKLVYVLQESDSTTPNEIDKVKTDALKHFSGKEESYLQNAMFSKIIDSVSTSNANFIACVKGQQAEVLVTSANFAHARLPIDNKDTVFYQYMTAADFVEGFLYPLKM